MRLVILLYEQAIKDVRRAIAAQQRGDIEERTREINHAVLVLGCLQGSLDRVQGGEVAQNLDHFYDHVRAGLLSAHCAQSPEEMERIVSQLMLVYDAWCEAEQGLASAVPAPADITEDAVAASEWKA